MGKQGGLGLRFYVGGNDVSGDINAISKIFGGPAALDFTGVDKLAMERQGGVRDGGMSFTSFFNPDVGRAHPTFSALPTTDVMVAVLIGPLTGNAAAVCIAKTPNYDATRGTDGSLTFNVDAVANGFGLEWGTQLTDGFTTITAAGNGTGIDTAASAAFGAQAYLQVKAFTGTDATIKLQDSADNVTYADITGGGFTQITAGPTTQRIALANTATVRRYIRAAVVTTGGLTSLTYSVIVNKNPIAGVTF